MGADIQIQVASKPISLREGERIELKGEHFRRTEYLNGRVEEVKLFEVNFTQESYRHVEIWREFELPRAPRHRASINRAPIYRRDQQIRPRVSSGSELAPSLSISRAGYEDLLELVVPQPDKAATTGTHRQPARKSSDQKGQELVRIKKEVTIKGITVLMEQTVVSDRGLELTGDEPVVSQRALEIRGASLDDRERSDVNDSFEMSVQEEYALLERMLGISNPSTTVTPLRLTEEETVTEDLSEANAEPEARREDLRESHGVSEHISDLLAHEVAASLPRFDILGDVGEQMITSSIDGSQAAKLGISLLEAEPPISGERLRVSERSEVIASVYELAHISETLLEYVPNEREQLIAHVSPEVLIMGNSIADIHRGVDRETELLRGALLTTEQLRGDLIRTEEVVVSRQSELLLPTASADTIFLVEATAVQESASSAPLRSDHEPASHHSLIAEEGVLEAEYVLEHKLSRSPEMPSSQAFQDLINEALAIRAPIFRKQAEIKDDFQLAA